ncbi:MAG TPA: class I SAM-dependent rRNA methyltransferase [Lentimicrobium sp.]|nr:class I SAM-dependent rRNA methyltransferase [Lentimicrobium sp.]
MSELAIAKVILNKGREESVKRYHPWIFSGAIDRIEGRITEGDYVDVVDYKGTYLATGFASQGSIAVKVFWFGPLQPPEDIWYHKISKAYALRQSLGFTNNPNSNAYRLVFSEADGLPGIVIDYYNGVAVIQAHSLGMYLVRDQICEALLKLYNTELIAVYDKSSEAMAKSGAESEGDGFLYGSIDELIVRENGHRFLIDFIKGQKTGFFLDQRDNRALLGKYSSNKKVLNVFCYTGGFSMYALAAGASHVTSLDASKKAIDALENNLLLNAGYKGTHTSIVADAKVWLPGMDDDYDIIVLDPPAFAKRQSDRHKALQGYKFINQTAISKIKPGGLLFTFSCSQAISNEQFSSMIMASAIEARRNVRIIHHMGHSADHPVSIFHPEGEYLKGLVVSID